VRRRLFLELGVGSLVMHSLARSAAHLCAQERNSVPGPIVETTNGKVRGLLDGGVSTFKGIRYGMSTAGERRFMPAVGPEPWTGVVEASEYGPRAPQPFRPMIPEIGDALIGQGPMDEDCLRLDIWTPRVERGASRPVMVWLHGGGFRTGSGNATFYNGHELARKHDVVVVTITHRLHALGNLYLAGLPGIGERFSRTSNLGILDLVAALEWVRDNIDAFGGSPKAVTIFGQSGGGGKVAMLTATPAAKGLFHRAIIMSTLADTAITGLEPPRAIEAAELLLSRLSVKPADADKLQKMPVGRIVEALTGGAGRAGGQAGVAGPGADISLRYTPVVDGRTIPSHPFEPVASDISAAIPIMCGSNETEGVPYGAPDDPYWTREATDEASLREQMKRIVPLDDAAASRLITLYKSHRPQDTFGDLAAVMTGDNSPLRLSAYTIAERKFAQRSAPVFLYYFNWRSPARDGKLRTMHCMELPFVFDHVDDMQYMTGTGRDRYALAQVMSEAWVSFARSGNPSHAGLPKWLPFDPAKRPTMVFNTETRLVDDPYGEERRAMQAARG
jgi:para-nitrobenzyl esterase